MAGSEIKVNQISPKQTCTAITVGNSGNTVTIPCGATFKTAGVNNLNSSTMVAQTNSTTITVGFSGATVSLASGASSSGFGATYTGGISWSTTVQTSGFTAVSGTGYFCNTTSSAFTVTLPATPSVGASVAIKDYASTAGTNNITIGANGSKIQGQSSNYYIRVNGTSVTFVYIDSTQGWSIVNDGLLNAASVSSNFVTATGGTVTTVGCYKVHAFTGVGCFTVLGTGSPAGSTTVDYLVVAGGGGGAISNLGGGGAGGLRTASSYPIAITTYPIIVGAGGTGATPTSSGNGLQGGNSIFSFITSQGGGGGGNFPGACMPSPGYPTVSCGSSGGSGGAIGRDAYLAGRSSANNGNNPYVKPIQGYPGGVYSYGPGGTCGSAGGGGSAAVGNPGYPGNSGGAGGAGTLVTATFGAAPQPFYRADVTGAGVTSTGYFAGGGGGSGTSSPGAGGIGGGGRGSNPTTAAVSGTSNSGSGGGGSGPSPGASGGSGIVLIRYKFQ